MSFIFDLSINKLGPLVADTLVGYIETFQGMVSEWLASMGTSDFLNALLTDGIIGGVGAVVGFVPLVMVLMFLLSLVEDSGFMARIALIFDPLFRKDWIIRKIYNTYDSRIWMLYTRNYGYKNYKR